MSKPLPRLRMDLDFMPSPVEDRPGLLIRDPFHYSTVTLIIPPPLVPLLNMLDGQQTEDEMRRVLLDMTQDLRIGEVQDQLLEALVKAGFVHGEVFEEMRAARQAAFAREELRMPAHAGSVYPDDREELGSWLAHERIGAADEGGGGLIGIAAPHASPDGSWDSYRQAYRALGPADAERVFVVLGTSHYGAPEKFGLTRKHFVTPFGEARTEIGLVDWLAANAPRAVLMEDYCHAVEHSLEIQVVMLQALYGPQVKVLPVLCGPFAKSLYDGGAPDDDEGVKEFLASLGELHAREGKRLCWVLGVDMAHMGKRYGDPLAMKGQAGEMLDVAARDRERIGRMVAGDANGFWDLVQPNHDDLKWCGSSPLYTFMKAVPEALGELRHYEHWEIDAESVVTFGALTWRA